MKKQIPGLILVTLVVLLLLFGVSMTIVVNNNSFLSAILPSVLVDLANEARVESNYHPLMISPELTRAAELKANDMASKGYFSHTSPEGLTPWYWIGRTGYEFIYAGENLAVDFSYSTDVNAAWLASPGHAANIFSPNFTEIGIATAQGTYDGHETIFVVQIFGTPAPQVAQRPAPEVKEAKVNVVEEVVVNESEKFIVAQNQEFEEVAVEEVTPPGIVQQGEAPGYEKYSRWYQELILNPAKLTEYALYVAVAVIAISILISVMATENNQRGLMYGIFLLVVLLTIIYLNRTGLVTETIHKYFGGL